VSALNILAIASEGKWVRIMSNPKAKQYSYQVSGKKFEDVPPRFTNRPFLDLIDMHFTQDRKVNDLDHEIWEALKNGSKR
jgi:hypothetical protein